MQKGAEGLQFSYLLDIAAASDHDSSLMQMVYVAAFDITLGSCLYERMAKPFTPLLNETYECDRTQDGENSLGWRYMSEYYAHYPPSYASVNCEPIRNKWEVAICITCSKDNWKNCSELN